MPDDAQADAQREVLNAVDAAMEGELAIGLAEDACAATGQLAADLRVLAEAARTARQDIASEFLDEISGLVGQYSPASILGRRSNPGVNSIVNAAQPVRLVPLGRVCPHAA